MAEDKDPKLTHREQLFVAAYLGEARGNATRAAELAGYSSKLDFSALSGEDLAKAKLRHYNTLRKQASSTLKLPQVKAAIEADLALHGMGADEVLAELAKVARIDVNDDPRQVKNKVQALAHLAKYHGLLVDRIDHTTKGQPLTFQALAELADEQSKTGESGS